MASSGKSHAEAARAARERDHEAILGNSRQHNFERKGSLDHQDGNTEILVRAGFENVRLKVRTVLKPNKKDVKGIHMFAGVDSDGRFYTGETGHMRGHFNRFANPIPKGKMVTTDWWYDGGRGLMLPVKITVLDDTDPIVEHGQLQPDDAKLVSLASTTWRHAKGGVGKFFTSLPLRAQGRHFPFDSVHSRAKGLTFDEQGRLR